MGQCHMKKSSRAVSRRLRQRGALVRGVMPFAAEPALHHDAAIQGEGKALVVTMRLHNYGYAFDTPELVSRVRAGSGYSQSFKL